MSVTRKIQVRRGTATQWSTANPTLSSGEFGYDSTNKSLKIGDGTTPWDSLDGLVPSQIVYTSKTCVSDANLSLNSTTFGTDQTAALQAILDKAQDGPLTVIWDGAYSCTGLVIRGNTTIQALPNCGAILRNSANRPIFRNANQTVNPNAIVDKNISIIGGIWHGNGDNQTHHIVGQGWIVGMEFVGIENLLMRDCVIYKPRTFATLKINWLKVTCDNVRIDVGTETGFNYDGFHFNGPGRYCDIRNLVVRSMDDGLAFNANEPMDGAAVGYHPLFDTGGDITDVSVNGVTLADSSFGIRLLSSTSLITRVNINDVKGVTGNQAFIIDNYSENPTFMRPNGPGNFGSISISNVDVAVSRSLGYKESVVYCSAKVESLRLSKIHRNNFSLNNRTVRIDSGADITQLVIDGATSVSSSATNATNQITNTGVVNSMIVRNCNWMNTGDNSAGYIVQNTGSIRQLVSHGNAVTGFAGVLTNSGTIVSLNEADNWRIDPSTWVVGTNFTEVSSTGLNYAGLGAGAVDLSSKINAYSSQNILLSSTLNYATGTGQRTVLLFVRGANSNSWATQTCYCLSWNVRPGVDNSLSFFSHVAGSSTQLGTSLSITGFEFGVDYTVYVTAKDNGANVDLTAKVKRLSDNYWLQTDGTFAASEVVALSRTHSGSVISGAGRSGVGVYTFSDTSAITFRDFTQSNAP